MDKFRRKVEKMLEKLNGNQEIALKMSSNNFIDKDVQRIVFSLNSTLSLFLISKYSVKNDLIYPSGRISRLLSFCCISFIIISCVYRMFFLNIRDININMSTTEKDFLSLFTTVYFIIVIIGFTATFILNIVHKDRNVLLVLMIQSLYKSIDFSKSITRFVVWNWISIITVIASNTFINALYFSISNFTDVVDSILEIIFNVLYIGLEVNLVISVRIIILLRKYLQKWIQEVLMMSIEHENEERCLKLLQIYQSILKTYNLYKIIFQILVSW